MTHAERMIEGFNSVQAVTPAHPGSWMLNFAAESPTERHPAPIETLIYKLVNLQNQPRGP